jgi:hypothetical protein
MKALAEAEMAQSTPESGSPWGQSIRPVARPRRPTWRASSPPTSPKWGGVETEGSMPAPAGNRVGDGAACSTQTVTVRSCGGGFQPPAAGLAAL